MYSDDTFKQVYGLAGVVSPNGDPLPLHLVCERKEICWADSAHRVPTNDNGNSGISRPWVGSEYGKLRLLAIGENLNHYGGFCAITGLVISARKELLTGRRRLRFENVYSKYPGTLLFHRLESYASVFAKVKGFTSFNSSEGFPSQDEVQNAFDFIAYTNHIKCSPTGNKSEQTKGMWDNCGKQFLREEIKILKPESIIILGKSDNLRSVDSKVLDKPCSWLQHGLVASGTGTIDGREVKLFSVPHPNARGFKALSILSDQKAILGV